LQQKLRRRVLAFGDVGVGWNRDSAYELNDADSTGDAELLESLRFLGCL
jgi:hypothetical protein